MKYTNTHPVATEAGTPEKIGPRRWLSRSSFRVILLVVVLAAILIIRENGFSGSLGGRVQTFTTIFLSIFIEAVPFLLAGSIVSGLIAVFVNQELLYRFVPRNPVSAAFVGGSMGMIFPVCECGVVPVTRRLYNKGLPVSMGIAFMLAAPVINPVVLASTYAAYGWGPMLYGRFGLSFVIASVIGLIFYFAKPAEVLLPGKVQVPTSDAHLHSHNHDHDHDDDHHHAEQNHYPANNTRSGRFWEAMAIGGDDFFDMSRYLIIGCILAAGMQTVVPQPVLLELGSGTFTAIIAMMVLAFILSVCSTVDAFLSLAFVNTFPAPAILAFLVFGPMVDIKSSLMFLGVFKRRIVLYLILLPLMLTLMVTVFLSVR